MHRTQTLLFNVVYACVILIINHQPHLQEQVVSAIDHELVFKNTAFLGLGVFWQVAVPCSWPEYHPGLRGAACPRAQELGKQNPELLTLINGNQQEFLRIINEPVPPEQAAEVTQQIAQYQASLGSGAGEGSGATAFPVSGSRH